MKKFMSKLPVMIIMWIVTITVLVVMIVMASRPVSTGWAYKSEERDIMGLGEDQEITIIFEDEREIEAKVELEGLCFEMSMWYLRDGDEYVGIGISKMPPLILDVTGEDVMTARDFEEKVQYYKDDRQLWRELWKQSENISAFKCEFNGEELICYGAIVFTVVFSILSAIGLAGAIVSTVLFVKSRKKEVVATVNNQSQPSSPVQENQPQPETTKVEGQIEIEEIQE